MYVCMYVCMFVYVCMHVCTCVYICTLARDMSVTCWWPSYLTNSEDRVWKTANVLMPKCTEYAVRTEMEALWTFSVFRNPLQSVVSLLCNLYALLAIAFGAPNFVYRLYTYFVWLPNKLNHFMRPIFINWCLQRRSSIFLWGRKQIFW
jgi:hypothetical protein